MDADQHAPHTGHPGYHGHRGLNWSQNGQMHLTLGEVLFRAPSRLNAAAWLIIVPSSGTLASTATVDPTVDIGLPTFSIDRPPFPQAELEGRRTDTDTGSSGSSRSDWRMDYSSRHLS